MQLRDIVEINFTHGPYGVGAIGNLGINLAQIHITSAEGLMTIGVPKSWLVRVARNRWKLTIANLPTTAPTFDTEQGEILD
jgi:hypothetical protein